jgi:hypothetical protein
MRTKLDAPDLWFTLAVATVRQTSPSNRCSCAADEVGVTVPVNVTLFPTRTEVRSAVGTTANFTLGTAVWTTMYAGTFGLLGRPRDPDAEVGPRYGVRPPSQSHEGTSYRKDTCPSDPDAAGSNAANEPHQGADHPHWQIAAARASRRSAPAHPPPPHRRTLAYLESLHEQMPLALERWQDRRIPLRAIPAHG